VTLAVKSIVEWRHERELAAAAELPPERASVLLIPSPSGRGLG
jgi:sulfate transport system permease protein